MYVFQIFFSSLGWYLNLNKFRIIVDLQNSDVQYGIAMYTAISILFFVLAVQGHHSNDPDYCDPKMCPYQGTHVACGKNRVSLQFWGNQKSNLLPFIRLSAKCVVTVQRQYLWNRKQYKKYWMNIMDTASWWLAAKCNVFPRRLACQWWSVQSKMHNKCMFLKKYFD